MKKLVLPVAALTLLSFSAVKSFALGELVKAAGKAANLVKTTDAAVGGKIATIVGKEAAVVGAGNVAETFAAAEKQIKEIVPGITKADKQGFDKTTGKNPTAAKIQSAAKNAKVVNNNKQPVALSYDEIVKNFNPDGDWAHWRNVRAEAVYLALERYGYPSRNTSHVTFKESATWQKQVAVIDKVFGPYNGDPAGDVASPKYVFDFHPQSPEAKDSGWHYSGGYYDDGVVATPTRTSPPTAQEKKSRELVETANKYGASVTYDYGPFGIKGPDWNNPVQMAEHNAWVKNKRPLTPEEKSLIEAEAKFDFREANKNNPVFDRNSPAYGHFSTGIDYGPYGISGKPWD